jgi:hypothetical protein
VGTEAAIADTRGLNREAKGREAAGGEARV